MVEASLSPYQCTRGSVALGQERAKPDTVARYLLVNQPHSHKTLCAGKLKSYHLSGELPVPCPRPEVPTPDQSGTFSAGGTRQTI